MLMSPRRKDDEIVGLIKKLSSNKKEEVDSSKARLTIIGARAVENLIEALDLDNNEIKCNVICILGLIRDPRAKDPLIAMLLERNPKVRSAATSALSNFPSREVIRSLERLLSNERNIEGRLSAVRSLIDIFRNGDDGALSLILEIIFDRKEKREVRLASLSILPYLKSRERKALIKKLKSDADRKISEKAKEFESNSLWPDHGEADLFRWIQMLSSQDYEEFNRAIRYLIAAGTKTVDLLVGEMMRRAYDTEFCSRAGMVLKGLENSSLRFIIPYLERINESLPLRIMVDVLGNSEDKALLYSLKGLIDRINTDPRLSKSKEMKDHFRRIKARAHLQLARAGSRLAIDDLNRAILDQSSPLDLDLLSSFEYIGKKEELPYLIKAFSQKDDWTKHKIKTVFQRIMKREKIRKNNRILKVLEREDPATFRELINENVLDAQHESRIC